MKNKRIQYIFFILSFSLTISVTAQVDKVFFSELPSIALSKVYHLKEKEISPKLYIYVFLSPECPLCKSYIPALNSLKSAYKNEISILGIVPGKAYTKNEILKFGKEYNISFPLLIDSEKKLTNYVGATITPEVMVFTQRFERIYTGAVDDRLQKLGEQKIKASAHYLSDAVSAGLKGHPVQISKTQPIGCFINDY